MAVVTARCKNGCQFRQGLQCEEHARRAVLWAKPSRPDGSQTQAFSGRAALRTQLSELTMGTEAECVPAGPQGRGGGSECAELRASS